MVSQTLMFTYIGILPLISVLARIYIRHGIKNIPSNANGYKAPMDSRGVITI